MNADWDKMKLGQLGIGLIWVMGENDKRKTVMISGL